MTNRGGKSHSHYEHFHSVRNSSARSLELDHLALLLLVTAQLEVLAPLDGQLLAVLAIGALHLEHDLPGGLSLLVEDGLGLTTETALLAIVTALALRGEGVLALLVLGDLVHGVLAALLALAEGLARF